MKTALVTTTINVPRVLELYRKLGPDVRFFVAGDKKTPGKAYEFASALGKCHCILPDAYAPEHWKCKELIGWNCIQRRNIALLEAVAWGAEVIYTIDDDNIADGRSILRQRRGNWATAGRSKVFASSPTNWFDPGCLLAPQTKHRGFPISIKSDPVFSHVIDAKIGVAAGLCLGDPDIDACTRIATAPIIHCVSELGRAGVVVDPRETKTVFNSQNTAFIRELAPAMFMMPGIGRYDDIYASLICQRVMREKNLFVHFGQPFVWQQRNEHNLLSDLRQEIDGMTRIVEFADIMRWIDARSDTVVGSCRAIWTELGKTDWIPKQAVAAAFAFLDDIEAIL